MSDEDLDFVANIIREILEFMQNDLHEITEEIKPNKKKSKVIFGKKRLYIAKKISKTTDNVVIDALLKLDKRIQRAKIQMKDFIKGLINNILLWSNTIVLIMSFVGFVLN